MNQLTKGNEEKEGGSSGKIQVAIYGGNRHLFVPWYGA
jgi:hypothetical protein